MVASRADCNNNVCVATFASIIGVLRHYNGRPLDDLGLPNGLTLNGIVAALSTLNRVCLMVPVGTALSQETLLWFSPASAGIRHSRLRDLDVSDSASRGSWGALKLLLSVRNRRFIAFLGALTTVLSLAFGTFVQQLLSSQPVNITSLHSSLLPGNTPRSETWNSSKGAGSEANMEPLLDMKAAVLNGMLTQGITPLMPNCPSGNCT
ncbi:hypothetical protein BDV96DRAFT_45593 [Lophiotrema nucula]|uniref:Uncharacterized protein n=1 Tax=Lophiotrema nucula TaxID=690887 RepID=A0A6A5ZAC1_9PLEO|nr:hypothetical protein BDV96DRAFT_45593 [Lophiotrema nucula]